MVAKNILVVDDEEIILDLLAKVLTRLECAYFLARSGQQAVEILTNNKDKIDIAIVDLSMPEMDGLETVTRLREIKPSLSALISSGRSESEATGLCQAASADAYLTKPYRVDQLSRILNMVEEKRKKGGHTVSGTVSSSH